MFTATNLPVFRGARPILGRLSPALPASAGRPAPLSRSHFTAGILDTPNTLVGCLSQHPLSAGWTSATVKALRCGRPGYSEATRSKILSHRTQEQFPNLATNHEPRATDPKLLRTHSEPTNHTSNQDRRFDLKRGQSGTDSKTHFLRPVALFARFPVESECSGTLPLCVSCIIPFLFGLSSSIALAPSWFWIWCDARFSSPDLQPDNLAGTLFTASIAHPPRCPQS